ncbi:MAG: hypothetical protein AAB965_00560 [Patescibacteria group bacterium]
MEELRIIDEALNRANHQQAPIEVLKCEPFSGYIVTTKDGKTHLTKNLVSGSDMNTWLVGDDGKVYWIPRRK